MEDQITGDQIEDYLTSRLSPLRYMDHYTILDAMAARRETRARDKAEWDAMDDESKAFLLHQLSGNED